MHSIWKQWLNADKDVVFHEDAISPLAQVWSLGGCLSSNLHLGMQKEAVAGSPSYQFHLLYFSLGEDLGYFHLHLCNLSDGLLQFVYRAIKTKAWYRKHKDRERSLLLGAYNLAMFYTWYQQDNLKASVDVKFCCSLTRGCGIMGACATNCTAQMTGYHLGSIKLLILMLKIHHSLGAP